MQLQETEKENFVKINIPRAVKESIAILKLEQHAIQREHRLRIKELFNSVTAHDSSNGGGYQEKG